MIQRMLFRKVGGACEHQTVFALGERSLGFTFWGGKKSIKISPFSNIRNVGNINPQNIQEHCESLFPCSLLNISLPTTTQISGP